MDGAEVPGDGIDVSLYKQSILSTVREYLMVNILCDSVSHFLNIFNNLTMTVKLLRKQYKI